MEFAFGGVMKLLWFLSSVGILFMKILRRQLVTFMGLDTHLQYETITIFAIFGYGRYCEVTHRHFSPVTIQSLMKQHIIWEWDTDLRFVKPVW